MDTNIADRLEIEVEDEGDGLAHANAGMGANRLKAFRAIEPGERPLTGSHVTPPIKKGRRNGLMIGTCSVAVLMTAAGMFWISPYNHYTLRDATNFATHVRDIALNTLPKAAPLVAPAAELARAPDPTPTPIRDQLQPVGPQALGGGDDMAEFLRLGGQASPSSAFVPPPSSFVAPSSPAVAASPVPTKPAQVALAAPLLSALPKPAAPHLPAAQPVNRVVPVVEPAKVVAPPMPTPAPHAPKPEASAPAAPQDAVAKITELRPAPMTDPQQVQVLQLVTELGTLVHDQRAEIAQLRQDQQNADQRVDGALADFGRRLSLAEARGAVNAAMGVQMSSIQAAPLAPAPVRARAAAIGLETRSAVAAPADATLPRYHVQAASPGLAMLSALDASGGEDQQLPVSPGDSVPGWGKVISISQRGATWVVKTDHGLIQ